MNALNPTRRSYPIALFLLALGVPVSLIEPTAGRAEESRLITKTVAQQRAGNVAVPERDDTSEELPEPEPAGPEPKIKLNYVGAGWAKVLQDFADATNTELVADRVPSSKYSRWDWDRHTRDQALKILNQELEPQNFRLQIKGHYLVLTHLKELRHEYPPAVLHGPSSKTETEGAEHSEETSKSTAKSRRRNKGGLIQQVSADAADAEEAPSRSPARKVHVEPIQTTVKLKARGALAVSKAIYEPLKPYAELIDEGPGGFQGFSVRRGEPRQNDKKSAGAGQGTKARPAFAIGMDLNKNQLVVEAPPQATKAVLKMIKAVDVATKGSQGVIRTVATEKDADVVAAAVERPIRRLAAETRRVSQKVAQRSDDDADDQPVQRTLPQRRGAPGSGADEGPGGPNEELVGSVKGEVTVESVPEMGILVVKGNEKDVEAVMAVIREIERLSAGTAPAVEVALLRHVASESLAALLTSVYEKLGSARTATVQQTQAISVFPVSRPNAVLIVASQADMPHVVKLIDELDVETDPAMEFRVIRLKHAVPSQIVDNVRALYPAQQQGGQAAQQQGTTGLAPRVTIVDDVRTNSVIVMARPRDMKEVAALIEDLDVVDTASKQRIQIFRLEYAVADEVAFTLSQTIQAVLAPARATAAPTTGGPGQIGGQQGQAAQQGAAGSSAAEIRDVKSSILEFLVEDGEVGREIRSGILADIRMTPDLRTNSIVVTAPQESMELVAALIKRLDRPAAVVASIKVFKVKNGDASAMEQLLERLFGIQRTGQPGQQQGGAGGAAGVPGLLVAEAEDSSSMLVPLRFSVDVRTNSIIAVGGAAALDVVQAVVLTLDESDVQQRKNEVYRLKNAPAQNVATAISQFLQTQQQVLTQEQGLLSPFEQIQREVVVVPEITSNSLLLSATPRFFDNIMELVIKLDRSPKQVLIQGLIVEVQLNNTDEFGIEMGLQSSILFQRSALTGNPIFQSITNTSPIGVQTTTQNILSQSATPGYLFSGQPLGNNTSPVVNQSQVGTQGMTGFNTGLTNPTLGYGGLVLQAGSENVNFLLRALAARTRLDVLSRPQVRTVDNQLAQIMVGQEVPRINGFTPSGTAGVITPTVQQRAIGIILQVTPRISPENLVIMEVVARRDSLSNQSVSLGFSAAGTTITSPIINTTNAQTTIAIPSGQTVILGGMITKADDVEERKVPLLGDIPILGRAFRYDLKTMQRTELLIFLTPRVITNDDEGYQAAEMFKQIEIERLNFIESDAMQMHGPLYGLPDPPPHPTPATSPGTSPAMTPGTRPVPPPPEPQIPAAPADDTNTLPEPPPPGARALRYDDDEDLDAPFAQTRRRKAPKETAPGRIRLVNGEEPAASPDDAGGSREQTPTKKKKSRQSDRKPAAKRPVQDF